MPRIAVVCALVILASSCVRNGPYRIRYVKGQPEVAKPLLEKLKAPEFDPTQTGSTAEFPYRLAFIEFDDRGEMFEREQLSNALRMIRDAKVDGEALKKPAMLAVFVHGWKNNASEKSGNVWGFRQLLAGLSLQFGEAVRPSSPVRTPVVGVYIGWRGAVLSPPILKEFTFWDRRDKSQNLPNAHLVEALLSLMYTARDPLDSRDNTISILIGHSFGGAVLESALTQSLGGLIAAARPGEAIRWPANLIVFVNEAAQATQSYQLIESMMEHVEERPRCLKDPQITHLEKEDMRIHHPLIVSISSTGDSANRVIFPVGQAVSRPFNSLRTYPRANRVGIKRQAPMFFNTTAHLREFRSHLIARSNDPEVREAVARGCDLYQISNLDGNDYSLVALPGVPNRTPFWVMHMPRAIVADHSAIFGHAFRKLLIDMIEKRRVPPPTTIPPAQLAPEVMMPFYKKTK